MPRYIMVNHQKYLVMKEEKDAIDLEALEKGLTDYFLDFDYVVGDWAYGKLRLKGFNSKTNPHFKCSATTAGRSCDPVSPQRALYGGGSGRDHPHPARPGHRLPLGQGADPRLHPHELSGGSLRGGGRFGSGRPGTSLRGAGRRADADGFPRRDGGRDRPLYLAGCLRRRLPQADLPPPAHFWRPARPGRHK